MHALASLEEIAALDAPQPDVVVVALQRLSDAPAALNTLLAHQRDRDWCVLNLRQVTVASALADLLVKTDRRTEALARAMDRMAAKEKEAGKAGSKVHNLWARVSGLGTRAINLVRIEAVCRLDFIHGEITSLLDAVTQPNAPPQLHFGHFVSTPPPSHNEGELVNDLKLALISLRDANRSVQRRMLRLERALTHIENFLKLPEAEGRHAIPSVDREFRRIASRVALSTRQVLGQLAAASDKAGRNLLVAHQQVLQDQDHLSKTINFDHTLFSGFMPVRSLRDLEDVFRTSTPHMSEVGLPARRVTATLRGLNQLRDATLVRQRIHEGVEQRGWIVHGLNCLNTAINLDDRLVAIEARLVHLLHNIDLSGAIFAPDDIDHIEIQQGELASMMYDEACLISCAEVSMLTLMVSETLEIAGGPPNIALREQVGKVITAVGVTRMSEVLYRL